MIINAEIISRPDSGEYMERIYDVESAWNSQSWTFVRFTDENYEQWCGQFLGERKRVAISEISKRVLILTSDYLFSIDLNNGDLIEFDNSPGYINLIAINDGNFLVSDYYNITKILDKLSNTKHIESPIQMDVIKFELWDGNFLNFSCDEFLHWDRHLKMRYNSETDEVKIL